MASLLNSLKKMTQNEKNEGLLIKVWKILVTLFVLFCLWGYSQNGRYSYLHPGDAVLDTRTGRLYEYGTDAVTPAVQFNKQ